MMMSAVLRVQMGEIDDSWHHCTECSSDMHHAPDKASGV
jgi:hypothetical protein